MRPWKVTHSITLKDVMAKSFYEVLKVEPGIGSWELTKKYNACVSEYHPEKGGNVDIFKYIKLVYEVLKSPATRSEYDLHGKEKFQSKVMSLQSPVELPVSASSGVMASGKCKCRLLPSTKVS